MRFRHVYTIVGTILVLVFWTATDPDLGLITGMSYGASTIASLAILAKGVLYITLLHYSRKGLLDYIDLKEYFLKAKESSGGAGMALIAVSIIMLAIAVVIYAGTSN